ncbi:hypothetical protein EDC02_7633 [Micromonospora sp. Llam0]|nr:hypothetical protein EDC02_7633 [Micromonospora sp. Llam0]
MVRLAEHYRVDCWAAHFGGSGDQLVDLGLDAPLGVEARWGVLTAASADDAVREYLIRVSAGRPAARVFVWVDRGTSTALGALMRVVFGLGLAVELVARSYRHNAGDPVLAQGETWGVTATSPVRGAAVAFAAASPSMALAVAGFADSLGTQLHGLVPADPTRPIAVPQQPHPVEVGGDDYEYLMRRLAEYHEGAAVMARLFPGGCQVHVEARDATRLAATAATLRDAVVALLGPNALDR